MQRKYPVQTGQRRAGRPRKSAPTPEAENVQPDTPQILPSEPLFRMIVTNRAISLGSGRRAVLGDEIEVTAHRRKSLLFWRQARDA